MRLLARLRGWKRKNIEELHNLLDAFIAGVGTVFVGIGALFLALYVILSLDLGFFCTGVAALFVGGFNIRLSLAKWRKK